MTEFSFLGELTLKQVKTQVLCCSSSKE